MDCTYHQYTVLVVPVICLLAVLTALPPLTAVLFITILAAGLGILTYRLNNHFLTVFSLAFLFRVVLVVVDWTVKVLPTPPIASGHNQRAVELASAWANGQFFGVLNVDLMRTLIAHLLTPFYLVIGYSPMAGSVGIAFISLFVGYLIFRLARQITDRRTSVVAAAVVLFWPTIVARSVVIQREIVVVVALLAFLWASAQWIDAVTLPSVVVMILATMSMFVLRQENLFLIAVIVGFVSVVRSRDRLHYLAGLALLVIPFLAYFTFNFDRFTGFGNTLSPEAIDAFAYGRAHGDAAYLVGLHYDTWLDIVLYAPIKVLYYLYTPFPWHIRGPTELFAGMSALALLIATMGVRRGIAMLQDRPYYVGLLLSYLVTGVVTYAIIEMNYGAAVRRRIQFVPIILLLTVIGLSNVELNVRRSTR